VTGLEAPSAAEGWGGRDIVRDHQKPA